MKRKSLLRSHAKKEQLELQITSMADVFVILLVFLLKSYSVDGTPYQPKLPISPPVGHGRVEKSEALKLELSAKSLAIGGTPIVKMTDYRFSDLSKDGTSGALMRAFERMQRYSKDESGKLVVVADESAPYETIKAVLSSAANSGYNDIQLAVSHAN